MIASRNLEDLLPEIRAKAEAFIADAEKRLDIELRVTSTFRDFEEQDRLYSIGRTIPGAGVTKDRPMGSTVTKSRGGYSWHNWRRAFDVVPVRAGVALWNDLSLWELIGAIGIAHGLEWGGSWRAFPDRPHFQVRDGLTISGLLKDHPKGIA